MKPHTADVLMWQHQMELEDAAAEEGVVPVSALQQPQFKVSEFPAALVLQVMQQTLEVRVDTSVRTCAHAHVCVRARVCVCVCVCVCVFVCLMQQ